MSQLYGTFDYGFIIVWIRLFHWISVNQIWAFCKDFAPLHSPHHICGQTATFQSEASDMKVNRNLNWYSNNDKIFRNLCKWKFSPLKISCALIYMIILRLVTSCWLQRNSRWFQIMGIAKRSGHCLTRIYSNLSKLNVKRFITYLKSIPNKQIETNKPPKS